MRDRRPQSKKRLSRREYILLAVGILVAFFSWKWEWLLELRGMAYEQYATDIVPCYKEKAAKFFQKPVTFLGVGMNSSEKEFLKKNPGFLCGKKRIAEERSCWAQVFVKPGLDTNAFIDAFVERNPVFSDAQPYRILSDTRSPDGHSIAAVIFVIFLEDKLKHVQIVVDGSREKTILEKFDRLLGSRSDMFWPDTKRDRGHYAHPRACSSLDSSKYHYINFIRAAWGMKDGYVHIRPGTDHSHRYTYVEDKRRTDIYFEANDFLDLNRLVYYKAKGTKDSQSW